MKIVNEKPTTITEVIHHPIVKVAITLDHLNTPVFLCNSLFFHDGNQPTSVYQMEEPAKVHIERVSLSELQDEYGFAKDMEIKEEWAKDFVLRYTTDGGILRVVFVYANKLPIYLSKSPNLLNYIKLNPQPVIIDAIEVVDGCVNIRVALYEVQANGDAIESMTISIRNQAEHFDVKIDYEWEK